LKRLKRWGEEFESITEKSPPKKQKQNTNSHFFTRQRVNESESIQQTGERKLTLNNSHQVCLFRPADLSAADEQKEHKTKRKMIYCKT